MNYRKNENFKRHCTVIVDVTRGSFSDLLSYYLSLDKTTLVEFIEKNGHQIYHFVHTSKYRCCSCTHGYTPPTRKVLNQNQYEILFDVNGKKQHNTNQYTDSRNNCLDCCSPVEPNLTEDQLDITLLNSLLINFTDVKNDRNLKDILGELVKYRNETYAHVTTCAISDKEYAKIKYGVEKHLLVLARHYGKEEQVKQKLDDAYFEPLDEELNQKYLAKLKEWKRRDDEIKESLYSIQGTLEETNSKMDENNKTVQEKLDNILSEVRKTPSKKEENDENVIPPKIPRYDTTIKDTDEVDSLSPDKDGLRSLKTNNDEKTDNLTRNTNPITVIVLGKSDLTSFGEFGKFRIALQLCDIQKENILMAVAFNEHATTINEKLEEDEAYTISGYKVTQPDNPCLETEIRLIRSMQINLVENIDVPECLKTIKKKVTIAHAIENHKSSRLVWLNHVIITAIGPLQKPKEKYLREIMLKDYTGKIKLNVWSMSDDAEFQFSRGDVLEIGNVKVEHFNSKLNPEIYLTRTDFTKIAKIVDDMMKELLRNENPNEFKPEEMSIAEIKEIKHNSRIVIAGAKIDHFAKTGKEKFVFMNCGIEKRHGYLEERGSKLYCSECQAFRIGEHMVQLDAEIYDDFKDSVWVKLYNQSSKIVLGDKYDLFLEYDRAEQINILKKIEKKRLSYRFEIKKTQNNCNLQVTSITKL